MKLLLVDDLALMRCCIVELLHDQPDINVIAEAENGDELICSYFKFKPDLVLIDLNIQFLSGMEAFQKIKERDDNAKALFLSMNTGEEYIYACYKAGGQGLLSLNVDKQELIRAIREVHSGNLYFPKVTNEKLAEILIKYDKKNFRLNPYSIDLTHREKKILKLISEGFTTVQIAEKLHLSKRTIDTHRTHLVKKLDLRSLPHLIKYAIEFTKWNEMQAETSVREQEKI